MAPEGSGSIHQQVENVPNVPESLPNYSKCEFDSKNQSGLNPTDQELPTYVEARKLNCVL